MAIHRARDLRGELGSGGVDSCSMWGGVSGFLKSKSEPQDGQMTVWPVLGWCSGVPQLWHAFMVCAHSMGYRCSLYRLSFQLCNKNMSIHVASFYRFVSVDDPSSLKQYLLNAQVQYSVSGLVYVAAEGINGTVAGCQETVEAWLNALELDARFTGIGHRLSFAELDPFSGFRVRLKKGLVSLGVEDINVLSKRGLEVEPEDWNQLISQPDVVVIDMRKDLEYEMGSFKGAINMGADCFREFPQWAAENLSPEQRVAMFCTGGIRCEKASAYLAQQGFNEVYQLKGGILQYFSDVPVDEQTWTGKCFVFDHRGAVDGERQPVETELCYACSYPIREADKGHPNYLKNAYCPRCFPKWSSAQISRFKYRASSLIDRKPSI